MAAITSLIHILPREECDPEKSTCGEKPTSTFLKSGVPAIIIGALFLIALSICCYLLYKNKKKDAKAVKADRMWNDLHTTE